MKNIIISIGLALIAVNSLVAQEVIVKSKSKTLVASDASKKSEKFSADITVNLVQPSKTKLKNSVAVVIGVENYLSVPKAPYAAGDADLMAEYFQKRLGVEDVLLFREDEVNSIFFKRIFDTEKGELARKYIKQGETELFVYYSGHGMPDKNGEDTYLFPRDGKTEFLAESGYRMADFYNNLSKLNAKSVTVILDACFSGASRATATKVAENLVGTKGTLKLRVNQPWQAYKNFTVINACSLDQTSLGYDEAGNGLFTYFLAAGLNGLADDNRDGKITLGELKRYVQKNVSQTSKKISSGDQSPEFFGDESRVLVQY
jgi:hypothetical protein